MPLNGNPVGKQIADYFVAQAPAPGTPVTDTQLETIWQGAIGLLYTDVKATADVVPVSHSALPLSAPANQPVDVTTGPGAGSTGMTTADTIIDGTGSIL